MNNEMTPIQLKAQELYLQSATYNNDFKPMSLEKLVEVLRDEHEMQTSSSALGRWKKKFNWEDLLAVQISASTVEDEKIKAVIESSSMSANAEKIFDDFKANESIKNGSYELAEKQLQHYREVAEKKGFLSDKDMKMVIELLKLTSDREDKLLDRQAMLSAAKLVNSTDVLAELTSQKLNTEDAVEIEIDE